jgi:hypothetical protein
VSDNTKLSHDSRGFTLVELNLSLVIMGVMVVSLLVIFTNFFVIMTRTNAIVDMTVDSQGLLRTVVEELRYGAGVRQSNTITDANAPPGGWDTDNANFVIVIAVPATDEDRNYIIDSATGSPYMNELVYYKSGSILHKRVLAHPSAVNNALKTSCPAAIATSSCPADRKLVETIKTMTFNLYDQDNAPTSDPLLARSIKIDLTLERDTFGQALSYDNSVRITLRNTY